ncbi:MAG: membrane protein insertase YidC [Candidatus Melainabacteria bacterium]|nr:membrane protein insertase YidC [Candidatus Melainabacteria bacterium]
MDLTYSFMLPVLQAFQKWTGSYGWSLVLLTLFVRAILWPLVAKQTQSMQRMSSLSPTLKKLQTKYKNDPELMQKKLMGFYAKNRVSPVGGCLPMLLQLPIFFALFATFSGPPFGDKPIPVHVKVVAAKDTKVIKKETSNDSIPYVTAGTGALSKVTVFPGESDVSVGTELDFGTRAVDGTLPPEFKVHWTMKKDNKVVEPAEGTIDENGHAVFNKEGDYQVEALVPGIASHEPFGFVSGLGKVASGTALFKPENLDALALIIAFGFTMWLSQKYTMATSRPKDEEMDEQTRVQQDTMKILPLVTTATFFFIPLPVGVLIYIVLSNIVQSFQTWLLMKKPAAPLEGLEDLGLDDDTPVPPPPGGKSPSSPSDSPSKTAPSKTAKKLKLDTGTGSDIQSDSIIIDTGKVKKKKKK